MTMLPFEDDQVSLDGEGTSDEPVTDAAGQTVTADDDDAPLSDADLAHAKHAAAVVTGQASVAPPPVEKPKRAPRKDAGQPRPRKAKSGEPVSAEMLAPPPSNVQANVTLDIERHEDAQINNYIETAMREAQADLQTQVNQIGTPNDFPPENNPERAHANMRKQARRRLKSVARFATRASEISRMWPRNPDGFFSAACKLSDDIERFGDANATHASLAATLCAKLFPKDTLDVLTMSELVFAQ